MRTEVTPFEFEFAKFRIISNKNFTECFAKIKNKVSYEIKMKKTDFRIITNGVKYRIQERRRFLFFKYWYTHTNNSFYLDIKPIEFVQKRDAQEYIKEIIEEYKRKKWVVVND